MRLRLSNHLPRRSRAAVMCVLFAVGCAASNTRDAEPDCRAVETRWTFELGSSAEIESSFELLALDDGRGLFTTPDRIGLLDVDNQIRVLHQGADAIYRSDRSAAAGSFLVWDTTGFALYDLEATLLHHFEADSWQYARLLPAGQAVFVPDGVLGGPDDGFIVDAGRVFGPDGVLWGRFDAPHLRVSRVNADSVVHSNVNELVSHALDGTERWRVPLSMVTFEIAHHADILIANERGSEGGIRHVIDGAVGGRTAVDVAIWNLAIAPQGRFSIATTKDSVMLFDGGELHRTQPLPLEYITTADVSDDGLVLIGGQDFDSVSHALVLDADGHVLWETLGPIDDQGYRPQVAFAPGGQMFSVRTKTDLALYAVDMSACSAPQL